MISFIKKATVSFQTETRRLVRGLRLRWTLRGIGTVTTVHSDGRVASMSKTWPLGRFRDVPHSDRTERSDRAERKLIAAEESASK